MIPQSRGRSFPILFGSILSPTKYQVPVLVDKKGKEGEPIGLILVRPQAFPAVTVYSRPPENHSIASQRVT